MVCLLSLFLCFNKCVVVTLFGDKLIVSSCFSNSAFLHHANHVSVFNGR